VSAARPTCRQHSGPPAVLWASAWPRPTRTPQTDKPVIERTLGSVSTLFAQYVAGYVGRSIEHRGKDAGTGAAWSMAELQALLDE